MDEVRLGWETWLLQSQLTNSSKERNAVGHKGPWQGSVAAQQSLGIIPGWETLDFHLFKLSHDPRHPISNVALLNANW